MRIAIVSDIHEDIQSLEKALKRIKVLGFDMLLCLGDITGFAPVFHDHQPDANSCIELLRINSAISVVGNHDLFSVRKLPSYHDRIGMPKNWYDITVQERKKTTNDKVWLYQDEILPALKNENQEYLEKLEEFKILEIEGRNVLFSHFIEPDITGATKWFPFRSKELNDHFSLMKQNNCKLSFCAHSHQEGIAVVGKLFWSTSGFESYRVKSSSKIILCPPIVSGKSTPGFVIFDSENGLVKPYAIND